ncbi:MAG TPA: hypothetical protein VMH35_02290 [Streptosporangiaceae bacterium]|nr:hypothetical protein [Streptosporangiaceae bacterium]
MYQPCPSAGQPAEPPRPPAPAPVLTAVKLMYAGAAISTVALILWLAIGIGDVSAAARGRWLGHSLTGDLLSQLQPLIITMLMVAGLVMIALWLWMARANGQGRDWARILSTALFGLAALQLISIWSQPVAHVGSGGTVPGWIVSMLTWRIVPALTCLTGLAAVWLLWRPASSAFFEPHGNGHM